MKGSILGLSVAALAFAGSSLYLYRQLDAERTRADEVTELTRRLNARIAELERARTEFAEQRFAAGGAFGGVEMAQGGPGPGMPPPELAAAPKPTEADEATTTPFRPDRSPAMQKMMKVQMRANSKRMYGDFAEQAGLSKEEANQLYDLLAEQQMGRFGRARNDDPNVARANYEEQRRQNQSALVDLLGADKAQSLQQYQESIPARGEVEMIARQLEGSDTTLSDDQRKRLVSALTEERTRVPEPDYATYGENEAYTKAFNDWQTDYNERSTARARSILDSDQLTAYNEYQQWQKEMREQFATMRPGQRRFRGGGVAGNAVMISPGAPVVVTESNAFVAAPAPPPPPTENTTKPK